MGCCGRVRGNPEMERQEPCFFSTVQKKTVHKKNSVRPPFLPRPPRRRASALHLCQRSATAAPARPQHPCHPLGSARCSLVCFRARRVHASGVGGTGDSHRSSAAGAAQRAPTSSSCSAPQKTHSPGPHTRVRGPSHGPFCRTALGRRSVPRSELRHALHTARTRPPETRTCAAGRAQSPPASSTHARCSHRVDAQTAHGRCWRCRSSGVGG